MESLARGESCWCVFSVKESCPEHGGESPRLSSALLGDGRSMLFSQACLTPRWPCSGRAFLVEQSNAAVQCVLIPAVFGFDRSNMRYAACRTARQNHAISCTQDLFALLTQADSSNKSRSWCPAAVKWRCSEARCQQQRAKEECGEEDRGQEPSDF